MNSLRQCPMSVYAYFCYLIGGGGGAIAGSVCDANEEAYPEGISRRFMEIRVNLLIITKMKNIIIFT